MSSRPWSIVRPLVPLGFLPLACCQSAYVGRTQAKLDQYMYEDTKQLVLLVEDAAGMIEQRGRAAFDEFAKYGSRWFHDQTYLFVYDLDGGCVFHPVNPELVGKNMIDLKDMNGETVIRRITEIGMRPEPDASGWVFYLWEDSPQLVPGWKSSYVRKAVAPDKKIYLVGCGLYYIKIEKVFVKERVDMAAQLLQTAGKEVAFAQFRDPASPFRFFNIYIFVMDMNGHALMDAAYPTVSGRDLTRIQDAVGRYVVNEVLEKLQISDEAWVQHMWPTPGAITPSRKLVYAHKVRVGDETLVVGSDFFLATPIWMRL